MIVSKKNRFVFIKTPKTAGSSLEFYLSQFCGKNDIITPLQPDEEILKKKLSIPIKRNYIIKKFSLKNFKKFKFTKKIVLHDHVSLKYLERHIKLNLKDYFIFAFVRNPFDWIVSHFWWNLYFYKIFEIREINKLKKNEIKILFKLYLNLNCSFFFSTVRQMIESKNNKVKIFKFEDLTKNVIIIEKQLKLKKRKVDFADINLKSLPIKSQVRKKLKLDKNDVKLILKEGKYFFDQNKYSKIPPKNYI